ncbi:zinc-binding dehydrogenase [Kibdelosporangium aridum]|uniref:zinc-binding dehydrogenase n=1 Tax=Kibdelosporangium aridum TaxID=2030 RepID=UPI0006910759
MHASSLNRGELRLLATRPAGWRPGQDIAGVVEQAAADGTGPRAGERVVALADDSGWAEFVAVDTDRIAVLDDRVTFDGAADGPFDLITESVGGDSLAEAISRVAPYGLIVVFGLSSGQATPIAFRDFAPGHEGARIQTYMSYASGPGVGADLKILSDLVAEGALKAQVGLEIPWTEVALAVKSLSERGIDGKAVLVVNA